MPPLSAIVRSLTALVLPLLLAAPGWAADDGWIDLSSNARAREGWQKLKEDWRIAGSVALDAKNPRKLVSEPGDGILVNDVKGRAHDLLTRQKLGDAEVHVEFLIPKGSNSGVKMMGLYEIQIFDSYGKKKLTGADCGGIYPRAEMSPTYHHIDDGIAPKVNAARPPGEWQTLDIAFRAPRFDAEGKKTANARFLKVVLNGEVIHDDVEVKYPTGHAWHLKEVPTGPVLLQGDHGTIAFRNVKVLPLAGEK